MTTPAWLMLAATWTVILYFTGRFFWSVVRLSERDPPKAAPDPDRRGPPAPGAPH